MYVCFSDRPPILWCCDYVVYTNRVHNIINSTACMAKESTDKVKSTSLADRQYVIYSTITAKMVEPHFPRLSNGCFVSVFLSFLSVISFLFIFLTCLWGWDASGVDFPSTSHIIYIYTRHCGNSQKNKYIYIRVSNNYKVSHNAITRR